MNWLRNPGDDMVLREKVLYICNGLAGKRLYNQVSAGYFPRHHHHTAMLHKIRTRSSARITRGLKRGFLVRGEEEKRSRERAPFAD